MKTRRNTPGVLALLLTLAAGTLSARAGLVIVPTYDSSITSDPQHAVIEATIQDAINNIDAALSNSVTVDITFSEMSSGLGESNSYYYQTSYASYLSALQNNQVLSSDDRTAIASLGSGTAANPVNGDSDIIATQALLEALQVNVQGDGPLSGPVTGNSIQLNTSVMNLSRTGSQNPDFYDLEGVAAHEIDEILGVGGAGSNLSDGGSTTGPVGPLDLYRYSAPGTRSYSVTPGADPYFSINGGVSNLDYFNQEGAADGSDMSDWGNGITGAEYGNTPPQVQDAFGTPGAQPNLGPGEMTALDVAGWNLTSNGLQLEAVPEPRECWLLLIAPALVVTTRRRIRTVG